MAGTIAKYVDEGKEVIKVVFSYGESSHPHFKESIVKRRRVKETDSASNLLGIKETLFLGVKDTKVAEDFENKFGKEMLMKLIRKHDPEKIYLPSEQDPHPDHRAVHSHVLEAVDSLRKRYHVFAYEVWNVFKEECPFTYVDITPYFRKKLDYIRSFRSQWQYMYALFLPVLFRSRYYGLKAHCRYAERFYKIR